MKILGCDPGMSGALAIYWPDRSPKSGLQWIITDMPTVGDHINAPALRDFLHRYSPDCAIIESVSAMRGWGSHSVFAFGAAFGALSGIVASSNIPITLVRPQVWKKALSIKKPAKADQRQIKEISRQRAIQLFPNQQRDLERKQDHNRAEAMLLAYYGAKNIA